MARHIDRHMAQRTRENAASALAKIEAGRKRRGSGK
jgi:hypothetical protein